MILDLARGLLSRLLRIVLTFWLPLKSFELELEESGALVASNCVIDCAKLNALLGILHFEYVELLAERIELPLSWEVLLKNGLQISCSGLHLKISESALVRSSAPKASFAAASALDDQFSRADDQRLGDAARALAAGYHSVLLGRVGVSCSTGSIEVSLSKGSTLTIAFSSLCVRLSEARVGPEEGREEAPNRTSARLLSRRAQPEPLNFVSNGSSASGKSTHTHVAASRLVLSVTRGPTSLIAAAFESATFSASADSGLVELGMATVQCQCLAGAAEALGRTGSLLCGRDEEDEEGDGFHTPREDEDDTRWPQQAPGTGGSASPWKTVVSVAGLEATFGAGEEEGDVVIKVSPAQLTVLPPLQDCYPSSGCPSVSFPSLVADCLYRGSPLRVSVTEGTVAGGKAGGALFSVEADRDGHAVRADGEGLTLSWGEGDEGAPRSGSASTIECVFMSVRISEGEGKGEGEMVPLLEVAGEEGGCGLRVLAVSREERGGGQQCLTLALSLGAASLHHPWREARGCGWPLWLSVVTGLVPPPSSGGHISSVTCSLHRVAVTSKRLTALRASASGLCLALTLVPGVGFVNVFASAEDIEVVTAPGGREEESEGTEGAEGWLRVCASVGAGSGLSISGVSVDVLVPTETRGAGAEGEVREVMAQLVQAVCERAEDEEEREPWSQWEEEGGSEEGGPVSVVGSECGIPLLPLRPASLVDDKGRDSAAKKEEEDGEENAPEGTARWLRPAERGREGGSGSYSSLEGSHSAGGGAGAEQSSRWLVDTAQLQHVPHHFPSPAPPAAPKDPGTARVRVLADVLRVRLYPPDYAGPSDAASPAHHLCVTLSKADCQLSQPRDAAAPALSASLTFADLCVLLVAAGGGSQVVVHGLAGAREEGSGGSVGLVRAGRRAELNVALSPLRVWLSSEVMLAWAELAAALGSGSGSGDGGGGGSSVERYEDSGLGLPLELRVSLGPLLLVVDNAPSPKAFRYARLQEGRLLEYLHLVPLSAMPLHLLPVSRTLSLSDAAAQPAETRGAGGRGGRDGAEGWMLAPSSCSIVGGVRVSPSAEFLIDAVMSDWLRDIAARQVPALVRGVVPSKLLLHLQTLTPALSPQEGRGHAASRTRSLSGGSAASLVSRLGAVKAMRGVGLALSQDAAQLVYLLSSRVAAVLRDFSEEGEGGVHGGPPLTLPLSMPLRPQQPAGARDGMVLAMGVVTQSVTRTLDAAMRLPAGGGLGLTARKVVQAMPVLLVAPMAGFAEGISLLSMGVRNGLDPDKRREDEERRTRGHY